MKKILKFYSETCGPCKLMNMKLAKLKDVEIQGVDIADEANGHLLEEYKIKAIPTIIVLAEDGSSLARFVGVIPVENIQAVIDGGQTATA